MSLPIIGGTVPERVAVNGASVFFFAPNRFKKDTVPDSLTATMSMAASTALVASKAKLLIARRPVVAPGSLRAMTVLSKESAEEYKKQVSPPSRRTAEMALESTIR